LHEGLTAPSHKQKDSKYLPVNIRNIIIINLTLKLKPMKPFTLSIALLLFTNIGVFSQGSLIIRGSGAVTINGNTIINAPSFVCGNPLTDVRDNMVYTTVQIGTQCWMKQNLNYGTRIDGALEQTNNVIPEKYCYNNIESNCDVYGGLYQWNEAMQYSITEGGQGMCPAGWHVPSDAEWTTLSTHLGGEDIAGGKMKEAGTVHWASPNLGSTNSSGFSALPGGYKYTGGSYSNLTLGAYYWSSSHFVAIFAWSKFILEEGENIYRNIYDETHGFSVRCLKD
jgi:uncharacterized protein (TIGR02145 family)